MQERWLRRMQDKPALNPWYTGLKKELKMEQYLVDVEDSWGRKLVTDIRSGNNMLRMNTDRWLDPRPPREDRLCPMCLQEGTDQVEDGAHFLTECGEYSRERDMLWIERQRILGDDADINAADRDETVRELVGDGQKGRNPSQKKVLSQYTAKYVKIAMQKRKNAVGRIRKDQIRRSRMGYTSGITGVSRY